MKNVIEKYAKQYALPGQHDYEPASFLIVNEEIQKALTNKLDIDIGQILVLRDKDRVDILDPERDYEGDSVSFINMPYHSEETLNINICSIREAGYIIENQLRDMRDEKNDKGCYPKSEIMSEEFVVQATHFVDTVKDVQKMILDEHDDIDIREKAYTYLFNRQKINSDLTHYGKERMIEKVLRLRAAIASRDPKHEDALANPLFAPYEIDEENPPRILNELLDIQKDDSDHEEPDYYEKTPDGSISEDIFAPVTRMREESIEFLKCDQDQYKILKEKLRAFEDKQDGEKIINRMKLVTDHMIFVDPYLKPHYEWSGMVAVKENQYGEKMDILIMEDEAGYYAYSWPHDSRVERELVLDAIRDAKQGGIKYSRPEIYRLDDNLYDIENPRRLVASDIKDNGPE